MDLLPNLIFGRQMTCNDDNQVVYALVDFQILEAASFATHLTKNVIDFLFYYVKTMPATSNKQPVQYLIAEYPPSLITFYRREALPCQSPRLFHKLPATL
jgi:hypothetical protein